MLTVGVEETTVEADLAARRLACPKCGEGRLAGWGWARPRTVRGVGRLRPRRGRCGHPGCRAAHVLLPVACLARRADGVEVIGSAFEAAARGVAQRRVAELVGRPASTVRGWLGRLAGRAVLVRAAFAVLVRALAADPVVVEAGVPVLAGPVAMVAAAAGAAGRRWAHRVPALSRWELASFVTRGGLLLPSFTPESINTSPRLPNP